MSGMNFKCENCQKEFSISFLLFKPKEIKCPHCGGERVAEVKGCCSCGPKDKDNKGGFTFT